MKQGCARFGCLAFGIAIFIFELLEVFAVPAWIKRLTDQGLKSDDLSATMKLLIDLSNVERYYWQFTVPFTLILLGLGVVLVKVFQPKK